MQRAHIVVVDDSDHGLMLAARLRRMNVARVTTVTGPNAARAMCQVGGTDACIVLCDDAVPDAIEAPPNDAPGHGCGVPSIMIVQAVTPFLCKAARRRGYMAMVNASIAPRLLYRRVGAALQCRRGARSRPRRPGGSRLPGFRFAPPVAIGKPTLH